MASKVQICNRALSALGAARIVALTDGTGEAKYCNLMYNDVVEAVMCEGSWSSTIRRAELNATVNTPDFEYSYEFQLPTNPKCLKVLAIDELAPGSEEYRIEGDKLLANISTMHIKYVALLTDPQVFGTYLTEAIIAKLTYELSYPLTGQANVSNVMQGRYAELIGRNLALDGQQGSGEWFTSSDLTDVR